MTSSNLRKRSNTKTSEGRPTRVHGRPRIPEPRDPSVTLPIRPVLSPGESLPSYVDRLAAFWGVRLQTMLAITGIVDEDHALVPPVAYGVALSPKRLQAFSYVTRLPEETVSRMLLTGYDGIAFDLPDQELWRPEVIREAGAP